MWKPLKEVGIKNLKANTPCRTSENKQGKITEIRSNSDLVVRWDSGRFAWPVKFDHLQDDYHVWIQEEGESAA